MYIVGIYKTDSAYPFFGPVSAHRFLYFAKRQRARLEKQRNSYGFKFLSGKYLIFDDKLNLYVETEAE